MKKLLAALSLLVCWYWSSAQSSVADMTSLHWLVGTWETTDPSAGKTLLEVWTLQPEGYLSGEGISVKEGDTTLFERLQIVPKNDGMEYVAHVISNPAPVIFRMTDLGTRTFTVENPDHDFPRKIVYTFDGDKLTTRVSGDGQEYSAIYQKRD